MTPTHRHATDHRREDGASVCRCGAIAEWPDGAECDAETFGFDCRWPECMAMGCPGPLGDDTPPVWGEPERKAPWSRILHPPAFFFAVGIDAGAW